MKTTYHVEFCYGAPHVDSNWRGWSNRGILQNRAELALKRARAANPEKTFRLVKTTWTATEEVLPTAP